MVMPGLIDVHAHPGHEASYRGIREEHGVPEMYMSGLFERGGAYWPDEEGRLACAEAAYCELLVSGVTTLVDYLRHLSGLGRADGAERAARRAGARLRVGALGRAALAICSSTNGTSRPAGRSSSAALRLCDELATHPSGRLSGVMSPMQIDTCTEDLLRDSVAAARERKLPFTVHCAQAVAEFHEMVRRHGITPIQWAHRIGLAGPGTIFGHALFIDEHSWLHWWSRKDIAIMADTGASVAHCPTPFARYGHMLEDFGKYRRAGVNLGIGTDTVPQNLIEEMRWATVLARIAAEDIRTTEMADVFHAATAGGARALLRDDLGRLAPGAKADLVLVDLTKPVDDAGARSAALAHLPRRRSRGARRLRRRPTGGGRRPRPHARPGRRARAAGRGPAAHGGARARARRAAPLLGGDRAAQLAADALNDRRSVRARSRRRRAPRTGPARRRARRGP